MAVAVTNARQAASFTFPFAARLFIGRFAHVTKHIEFLKAFCLWLRHGWRVKTPSSVGYARENVLSNFFVFSNFFVSSVRCNHVVWIFRLCLILRCVRVLLSRVSLNNCCACVCVLWLLSPVQSLWQTYAALVVSWMSFCTDPNLAVSCAMYVVIFDFLFVDLRFV